MSIRIWLITGPLDAETKAHPTLRRWLARGRVRRVDSTQSTARRVMNALGHADVETDLAAIRHLAHNTAPPTGFIAAADPIYLEPRLDHLCVHRVAPSATEIRALAEHLNALLATDGGPTLTVADGSLYLQANSPLPTSEFTADAIDGLSPDKYIPGGEDAAAYRRFISEVEMALHEHPVNTDRGARGLQPVNGLWLWGGGTLPEQQALDLPRLVSDDAHLAGVWAACSGERDALTDSFDLSAVDGDAVVGPVGADRLAEVLEILRGMTGSRMSELNVLGRDGLEVRIGRRDWLRFFRRPAPEFG